MSYLAAALAALSLLALAGCEILRVHAEGAPGDIEWGVGITL